MAIHELTLNTTETSIELDKIHLSASNKEKLNQLLKEFSHAEVLKKYKLAVDHKLLLYGDTGCGKTTTAKAIAQSLNKKILILNLGGVIDSRLGQTAKNIAEVFKKASRENAVLFLDEFDYIGKIRDYDTKDSGEMKRLVNTVIQLIDQLPNNTLLIAATNHSSIIDNALLRRFQLKLEFEMPTNSELDIYYDTLLMQFPKEFRGLDRQYNLSYAEAKDIALRAIKNNIIEAEEANN
ncbi:ATPase family protein associated with various cellular activities (AAA) [Aquimarina sp. MAR_2010_214]|uniref:AAA family ATPase n=1 Tax=Aquimarina sp. MAR_2010_214 TaxID=1250026 RepID=UPI000C702039|nr:ATP-binding protein [Aquimarina sp. MAR_2010_214]PKV52577.1 ATPase family protein associated with various cellular activities (AAA) [Aquimarina sp. MAR_2010_214]